ncbi:MAG: LytTR family transcriptional regulator [Lentimicrobiaceae bacterium]|nr:LytTR family transcriptional regulator [Lentimicrobiaceae bacterium]
MSEQSNKKYTLRFGNKDLPAFLVTKENIRKLIFFTTVYSLIFINIFRPFNSDSWIPGINNFNYFLYSSLMVLIGLTLISISRIFMYFFVKKISIGYLEYLIWIFAEITILAGFYVFIAHKVGFIDNFILENTQYNYGEAVFEIYRKAVANTTWMLLIPYIISFLYLYNEYLIREVINKIDEKKENNIIQFKDEKDEVRFSIASEKVIYIESSDNYCIIKYLNNDKISDFILRNSLKKLSADLKDSPIHRCHRSYMINFEHVSSLKKDNSEISFEFDISNIKDIPISKSYSDKIMELFVVHSKQK